uniref:Tyrosine-protein phosphatase domain-containing protein n=1 Tax=Globodera pallida TaxID=36090 RepID=A0A183C450_GLOPA
MTPINCHQKGRSLWCRTPVTSFRAKQVLLALVALLHWTTTGGRAALLQVNKKGPALERSINDFQSELLRAELTRLAKLGLDWPDARAQCVLAYFKLAVAFQLDYDTEFCTVRNPENIWALVQKVQNALLAEAEAEQANVEDETQSLLVDDGAMAEPQDEAVVGEVEDEQMPVQSEEVDVIPILVLEEQNKPAIAKNRNGTPSDGEDEKRSSDGLSAAEVDELDQFVHKLLKGRQAGPREMGALSERQLSRLAQFIRQLQNVVQNNDDQKEAEEKVPEELLKEEAPPGIEEAAQGDEPMEHVLLLKKDSEQFNNADMGLANTVHKIVKGGIQRVEGNRVYLKVTKEQLTEQELYKLIAYLDKKIAQPNNLYFDEFLYENGQLSFRISRLGVSRKDKKDTNADSALDNASGVAQAVYKRRKDIQTLAGIRVDETGIGSGLDVVPVERSQRDWLFVPIMTVSTLTICTLFAVLVVNLARMRRRRQDSPIVPKAMPPGVDRGSKEAGCSLYEDLCRQRVAEEGAISHGVSVVGGRAGGDRSKHSSTSSWPDESCAPSGTDQLDIGTGHVLFTFLKDHLEKPGEVNREWESVKDYSNAAGETKVARRTENATKNVDATVLPYDDSLISLHCSNSCETLIDVSSSSAHSFGYYNASKIFDADPEPTYIMAQAPQEKTVATFWQMAWEQGVALLVNLCDKDETKSGRCVQYWPEEGSKAFGNFEVHLVSEHIWSEHYVVRSLYLKNSTTSETRTVTQFHFLSWPSGGMPESSKALLEFRSVCFVLMVEEFTPLVPPVQPYDCEAAASSTSTVQRQQNNCVVVDPCAHVVHVLMCYQVGGGDADFVRKAIESLVKKLKDCREQLDSLISAVTSGGKQPTSCVTIPVILVKVGAHLTKHFQRSLDGRLQVAGRKGLPHVVYARIWRWPNVNKTELLKLHNCATPADHADLICINPFHYDRVVSSGIANFDIATFRMEPLLTTSADSPHRPLDEQHPMPIAYPSANLPDPHHMLLLLFFLHLPSCSSQPPSTPYAEQSLHVQLVEGLLILSAICSNCATECPLGSPVLRLPPLPPSFSPWHISASPHSQLVPLNVTSGTLLVAGRIDRESLPVDANNGKCLLHFVFVSRAIGSSRLASSTSRTTTLAASSSSSFPPSSSSSSFLNASTKPSNALTSSFRLIRLTVEVLDVNDNAPTFGVDPLSLSISESASPLTQNEDISALFRAEKGPAGDFVLELRDGQLDRERTAQLHGQMKVWDVGTPRMEAIVELYIRLLDANDNAPCFERALYTVTLDPNYKMSSDKVSVGKVSATDADEGVNGQVRYELSERTGAIEVDERTGELFISRRRAESVCPPKGDSNSLSDCTFVVNAIDGGMPPLSAKATVVVQFAKGVGAEVASNETGEKKHPGRRDDRLQGRLRIKNLPSGLPFASLNANTPNGTVVSVVTMENVGEEEAIDFGLKGSEGLFRLEQIRNGLALLRLNGTVENDGNARQWTVEIAGKRSDGRLIGPSERVQIFLRHASDDPAPLPLPALQTVRLPEDLPIGSLIARLNASSSAPSSPYSPNFTFRLASPEWEQFIQVNPVAGLLRLRRRLPPLREGEAIRQLAVKVELARDPPTPSAEEHSAQAEVRIEVFDGDRWDGLLGLHPTEGLLSLARDDVEWAASKDGTEMRAIAQLADGKAAVEQKFWLRIERKAFGEGAENFFHFPPLLTLFVPDEPPPRPGDLLANLARFSPLPNPCKLRFVLQMSENWWPNSSSNWAATELVTLLPDGEIRLLKEPPFGLTIWEREVKAAPQQPFDGPPIGERIVRVRLLIRRRSLRPLHSPLQCPDTPKTFRWPSNAPAGNLLGILEHNFAGGAEHIKRFQLLNLLDLFMLDELNGKLRIRSTEVGTDRGRHLDLRYRISEVGHPAGKLVECSAKVELLEESVRGEEGIGRRRIVRRELSQREASEQLQAGMEIAEMEQFLRNETTLVMSDLLGSGQQFQVRLQFHLWHFAYL